MKKQVALNVLWTVGKVCVVWQAVSMGVCEPPVRPLNNPFLGEKGRAAFGPTWNRAAAFMG